MLKNILFQIIVLLLHCNCQNLVKYGDFQSFANLPFNPLPSELSQFYNYPSDINGWYDQALGNVQFKQIFNCTTISVDLSSSQPMTLCQNILLQIGWKYTLQFDSYTTKYLQNLYLKTYLNQVQVNTLNIPNPSSFGHQVYSFSANKSLNQLCFNQTHSAASSYPLYLHRGGFIDNISIVVVEAFISFQQYILEELNQTLFIKSRYPYNEELKNVIQTKYDILIGEKPVYYQIKTSETGHYLIKIFTQQNFKLNTLKFIQKTAYIHQANTPQAYLSLSISTKKYFFYLQNNEITLLKNTNKLLIFMTEINSKILNLSQTFFFTYLINMIIDAQFLSLFYIFTQINAIPDFTRKIYHQLLSIIFFSESFIQYFLKFFNISVEAPEVNFEDQFVERIENQKNNQNWFGYYGFTSRVIKGDISNILVLILSLVKFCCIKLLKQLVSSCFLLMMKIKIKISNLFLAEFCYTIPLILISLSANTLYSVEKFISKSYKISCILFIFNCLICLFLQMFIKSFIWKRKKNRKDQKLAEKRNERQKSFVSTKKEIIKLRVVHREDIFLSKMKQDIKKAQPQKKILKVKRKIFIEQAFQMPMFFFIPALAFLGNAKVFLIFNSLTVFIRFFNFAKQTSGKTVIIIIDFLIGSVWVIHHSVFVLFLFYEGKDLNESEMQIIVNLGITAVMTIIFILILQSLKMIVKGVLILKNSFRMLSVLIKQRIQEIENKEQNKQDETDIYFIGVTKNKVDKKTKEKQSKSNKQNKLARKGIRQNGNTKKVRKQKRQKDGLMKRQRFFSFQEPNLERNFR